MARVVGEGGMYRAPRSVLTWFVTVSFNSTSSTGQQVIQFLQSEPYNAEEHNVKPVFDEEWRGSE